MITGKAVLDIPMYENDAEATNIREYFQRLLSELWLEGEGFSGKRPFGNSGWDYDLYSALVEAKAIKAKTDEDGNIEEMSPRERAKANALILSAIEALQ